MSEFCCVSIRIDPGPIECTVPASAVNQIAWLKIDPIEQILGAVGEDGGLKLRFADSGLQSESDLGSGQALGHVPALCLAARLSQFAGSLVIGMHLHRQLVAREKKLRQQRKTIRVGSRFAYQFPAKPLAQVTE